MPTYPYRCDICGHLFERFEAISAEPTKKCPVCSGNVKRLIGAGAGFILKGSGFYTTDYKHKENTVKVEKARKEKERRAISISDIPGQNQVEKIGKEVIRMKDLGEPAERINRELEPEVHKHTNLNKKLSPEKEREQTAHKLAETVKQVKAEFNT